MVDFRTMMACAEVRVVAANEGAVSAATYDVMNAASGMEAVVMNITEAAGNAVAVNAEAKAATTGAAVLSSEIVNTAETSAAAHAAATQACMIVAGPVSQAGEVSETRSSNKRKAGDQG
jgi:hypothetical protein